MELVVKSVSPETLKTATLVVAVGEGRTLGTAAKQIDELKQAVTRIESQKVGKDENRVEVRDNRGALYATVGLIISVVLAAITILAAITALKP